MSNGPILRLSPSCIGDQFSAVGHPRFVDPVPGQAKGDRRAVDRETYFAKKVGQSAAMVLVAVGEDAPLEAVLVLDYVGEIGQDEVDTEHFRVREHEAAVDQYRPAIHFEPGAIPPDLAQAAQENYADSRPQPGRLHIGGQLTLLHELRAVDDIMGIFDRNSTAKHC